VQTRWEKIAAVQRMLDHIEAHLDEPISLTALARAAHYSPWHAARLFEEITGTPPFTYIRKRRLSEAAVQLRDSEARVIDVAFDFVFGSHEGFTRAFAREFGVTPSRYRRSDDAVPRFMPPRLRDWYTRRQQGEIEMSEQKSHDTVFVQVVERPARKLILKRGQAATHYFAYCEEVGCEVWDVLTAIEDALQEPMGLWLPEGMRPPDSSRYVQGVEVAADYAGPIPEGFEIIELPPCQLMVFQGPPFEDRHFEQAISSLWDAMNAYDPERYGFAWADDDAPRFQLMPEGYRGYIEGRPVRRL